MAAGWFSILQKVPWSDVLVNAPAVAQGARKLLGHGGRQGVARSAFTASAGDNGRSGTRDSTGSR